MSVNLKLERFAAATWTSQYTDKDAVTHTRPWGTRIVKQIAHFFPCIRTWVNSAFNADLLKTRVALTTSITNLISQDLENLSDEKQSLIRNVAQKFNSLVGLVKTKNPKANLPEALDAEAIISDALKIPEAAPKVAPAITLTDAATSKPVSIQTQEVSSTEPAAPAVVAPAASLSDAPAAHAPASPGEESSPVSTPSPKDSRPLSKRRVQRAAGQHDSDSDSKKTGRKSSRAHKPNFRPE